ILFRTEGSQIALSYLLANTAQWEPIYLDGRTHIFAWKDPRTPGKAEAFSSLRYDALTRAFGNVPEADRIPEPKPQRLLSPWGLGLYLVGPPPRELQSDESEMHRLKFGSANEEYAQRHAILWQKTFPARLPGCAAVGVVSDGGVGGALTST